MALEKKTYLRRVRILFNADGTYERIDVVRYEAVLEDGQPVGYPKEVAVEEIEAPQELSPVVQALVAEVESTLRAEAAARYRAEEEVRAKAEAARVAAEKATAQQR